MSLKNYYAVLGVPHAATATELRNAFRKLAKTYHPDAAPENPFAETHFREIQEAYETLSDPERRRRYDEELWLRGLTNRSRNAVAMTPDWLLGEAEKLRRHMETVDSYRMSHSALREYAESLLSDEHLSVLQDAPAVRIAILDKLLASVRKLRMQQLQKLTPRLNQLVEDDPEALRRISGWLRERQDEEAWDKRRPWIVIAVAIIICVAIWLLRK